MNMYAAGTNLGQPPSEFLLFQHFIVGLGLKFLYTHFPQLPWYGAFLYLYLLVSIIVIGCAISHFRAWSSNVGLWLVLFFLFYLQVLVSPQFTICAGYLAIAGVLLLYRVASKPSPSKAANRCLLAFGVGLLLWAGLVRFYSLLLVLLSMAPLYVYALLAQPSSVWRRFVPLLFCTAIAAFVLNWTQLVYYAHSPGWEHFFPYNDVRADFIDRHKIAWDSTTEPIFRQVGWSQNDLAMLKSWFYLDLKVYSFKNLEFISRHTQVLARPTIEWAGLLAGLKESLLSYSGLAALLLCGLSVMKARKAERSCAVLAVVWYLALFTGITISQRHMPLRVWLVMLCCLYVTEFVLRSRQSATSSPEEEKTEGTAKQRILTLVSLFSLLCLGQIKASKQVSDNQAYYEKELEHDLAELMPRPKQLYVTWGGDFPYQAFQLPEEGRPASRQMEFLGLGVGNHDAVVQDRLHSLAIKDLYQAFYQRDDIFLICVEEKKMMLSQYVWEHYHTRVAAETAFKGLTFSVFKMKKLD